MANKPEKPTQPGGKPTHKKAPKSDKKAIVIMAAILGGLAVITLVAALGYDVDTKSSTPKNVQEFNDKGLSYTFQVNKKYTLTRVRSNPNIAGKPKRPVSVLGQIFVYEYDLGQSVDLNKKNYDNIYYKIVSKTRTQGHLNVDKPSLVKIGKNKKTLAIKGKITSSVNATKNNIWFTFKDKKEVQINCQNSVSKPCSQVLKTFRFK